MIALDHAMLPVFLTAILKLAVRPQAMGSGLSEAETRLPLD